MTSASTEERLAVLESRVRHLQRIEADVELRLRAVERAIWRASGGLAALMLILKYVLP